MSHSSTHKNKKMSIFSAAQVYDMMDMYAQKEREEFKKFLETFVDAAVDYYADIIHEDKISIMNDLMECVAHGDTTNGFAKAIIKKTKTFHHAKNTSHARNLVREVANSFGDANGYFAWSESGPHPSVNLYTLYTHTDFARKLADRIGGERFDIVVTSSLEKTLCNEEVEQYKNTVWVYVNLKKHI